MNTIPQDGILLVYKPSGPTSHDMVALVRRKTGIQRVGHAGTLDPFAEGLLILLIGRETTKRQTEFLTMDKTYETVIHFGAKSTTDDLAGTITTMSCEKKPSPDDIEKALQSFLGEIEQLPPNFSAKKIKGRKAYELARKGLIPDLKPKKVTILAIDLLDYSWPLLTIRVSVSSGTYIRALARDLGKKLECGAYCEKLIRTSIGPYLLRDAISL